MVRAFVAGLLSLALCLVVLPTAAAQTTTYTARIQLIAQGTAADVVPGSVFTVEIYCGDEVAQTRQVPVIDAIQPIAGPQISIVIGDCPGRERISVVPATPGYAAIETTSIRNNQNQAQFFIRKATEQTQLEIDAFSSLLAAPDFPGSYPPGYFPDGGWNYTIRSSCLTQPLTATLNGGSSNTNGSSYGVYYRSIFVDVPAVSPNGRPCSFTVVEDDTPFWDGPQAKIASIGEDFDDGASVFFAHQPNLTSTPADFDTVVAPAVTCLAGNGRVDVNIINNDSEAHEYIFTIGNRARRTEIAAGGWWRSPITGRPDGTLAYSVTRNGQLVHVDHAEVACDSAPAVSSPEVQILHYCSGGNGFVLAQMANPTGSSTPYILQVGTLRRSTTAGPYGAAVRGISGRPNGSHNVEVTSGGTVVAAETVVVDC